MSKPNQTNDDNLAQLYAKRKSQHPAPLSIKRQLLAKQQESQGTAYIFRRISYVAAAASTILLISLLVFQQSKHQPAQLEYQLVQLHTLAPQTESLAESTSQSIKNRYAEHYNNYLAQKKTYAAHHKTRATLQLVDSGWQLKNCHNEVLQLSNELITALSKIHQIDSQINSGDTVEIAFDQSGIILGITRSGNYLKC